MKIKVKVFPRSPQERIIEKDGILRIYVSAPADKGKANKRLIELLRDHLACKKASLRIVQGQTSRNKIIEMV